MNINQFYSNENPKVGELVLVIFIERKESFFDAKLIEYNYRGIMNYQDATKKRKVNSWNKVVPLNKNMVASVDEVDDKLKIVQLSITYLGDIFNEDLLPEQIQEKLLGTFSENRLLEGFIKSLCIVNKYKYDFIWTTLIYHLDKIRDNDTTIWKYFCDNIDNLDNWIIELKLDNDIANKIKVLYDKRNEIIINKIVSRIGIISSNGVSNTKKLLNEILNEITYNYTLKYDTAPYYIFETSSEDTTIEDHDYILNKIESESKKINDKIFIKIDYKGKIL